MVDFPAIVAAAISQKIERDERETRELGLSASDQTEPNLCDTCKEPGACCKNFILGGDEGTALLFPADDAFAPWRYVAEAPLPFVPVSSREVQTEGKIGLEYRFKCLALAENGRCRIHRSRPQLCRNFAPASAPICVYYKGPGDECASKS